MSLEEIKNELVLLNRTNGLNDRGSINYVFFAVWLYVFLSMKGNSSAERIAVPEKFALNAQLSRIADNNFNISEFQADLIQFENTCTTLSGIFSSIDFDSLALGASIQARTKTIEQLIVKLSNIWKNDTVGVNDGKLFDYVAAASPSLPHDYSNVIYDPSLDMLISSLVRENFADQPNLSIYDPAMNQGSLLMAFSEISETELTGQDINVTSLLMSRIRAIFHGVPENGFHYHNGFAIENDWPETGSKRFDAVVSIPPFGAQWKIPENAEKIPWINSFGIVPSRSKTEMAFIMHGLYYLKEHGVLAMVVPMGVLFRGGAEAKIRERLLSENLVDAVIGLPAHMFQVSSIPVVLLVLKNRRVEKDVLVIDAEQLRDGTRRERKPNFLAQIEVSKIVEIYQHREEISGVSVRASYAEIQKNQSNLNISRYVDTFVPEKLISSVELATELHRLDSIQEVNSKNLLIQMSILLEESSANDEDVKNINSILKNYLE